MSDLDSAAAIQFLRRAFEPEDWIAIFLKSYQVGLTTQRIGPVSRFMAPRFHAWLRIMNRRTYDCYVSVNAVTPGLRSRTKDAIAAVRHVFIEVDQDGPAWLSALTERHDLPAPSYVIESSPNRLHVLWRAAGFSTAFVERLQRHLAHDLHTDTAATSSAQLTRLPGYWNHKRHPASLVTVAYGPHDRRHSPEAFPAPPRPPSTARAARALIGPAPLDRVTRARRYLARVPPAIAGQHGDVHTYRVCCRIVRGFALDDPEAFEVLAEWNARCVPPWSQRELLAKIAHARRYGLEPIGGVLPRPSCAT